MVQLTAEQLNDLRTLEDTHNILRSEIARAKEAGLDMTDYEAKLAELEKVRSGILKVYGAGSKRRPVG